jgi:hypothetical protein
MLRKRYHNTSPMPSIRSGSRRWPRKAAATGRLLPRATSHCSRRAEGQGRTGPLLSQSTLESEELSNHVPHVRRDTMHLRLINTMLTRCTTSYASLAFTASGISQVTITSSLSGYDFWLDNINYVPTSGGGQAPIAGSPTPPAILVKVPPSSTQTPAPGGVSARGGR